MAVYSSDENVINCLRLTERQRQAVNSQLDKQSESFKGADFRDNKRYSYHASNGIIICIFHPGGTSSKFNVSPRNLSRNGIGFLHGNFIHKDTDCNVFLHKLNGQVVSIAGKIRRCIHLQGHIHEIGVEFQEEFNLADFIEGVNDSNITTSNEDLPKYTGKIAYVNQSEDDCDIFAHYMQSLGLETDTVQSVAQMEELISNQMFDVVVVDNVIKGGSGQEAIAKLKESGFAGAVLATSSDGNEEVVSTLEQAGAECVVIKPFVFEELISLLGMYLRRSTDGGEGDAIVSELWSDTTMRPLILKYLSRLENRIAKLEDHLKEADTTSFLSQILELRASAGTYGFPQMVEKADAIIKLAKQTEDQTLVRKQFNELIDICIAANRYKAD